MFEPLIANSVIEKHTITSVFFSVELGEIVMSVVATVLTVAFDQRCERSNFDRAPMWFDPPVRNSVDHARRMRVPVAANSVPK